MPGMRDVAKHAKVALSTVSTVLNNSDKYVSGEIRQKVLAAAVDLGYVLTEKKRFTRKTIAVILPVITSSFFPNVLNGIQDTVSQDKNFLLFYNSNFSFEKEQAYLQTLRKQSLTGVILDSICPADLEDSYLSWLEKEFIDNGIPVVMLERKIKSNRFYCIFIDNFLSAKIAVRHLIDLGHRKIAHILGNKHMRHSFERLEGYRQALKDSGIPADPELIQPGDFTPASGYTAMKKLLDIRGDFTALLSANDQMAIGAIKALRTAGKNVPNDCAVAGFDNLGVSTLVDPALTTINVPTFQMGRLAARIIVDAGEGRPYSHCNKLDSNLIVRRSSVRGGLQGA
ncbi:MAG: LacI family transcriptional regulator [Treponema sp.]|jgi:LacI family transcriptional regulator/LacI family repressor for deo operon, udp, cdd, tsx, nupC, and nupG|nr:LacI family transcriptional regulator [Treponema sp.]